MSVRRRATPKSGPSDGQLKVLFDEIDADGNGQLDAMELYSAAGKLGFGNLTSGEITSILREADCDGDDLIDFSEFKAIVNSARGTSSKWAKAGMVAMTIKRYNAMLDAGDELLAPIQQAVLVTSEQNARGQNVPGGSRIAAKICGQLLGTGILMAVGYIIGVMVAQNSHMQMQASMEKKVVKWAAIFAPIFQGLIAFFIMAVGWTRSQASMGHVLFGMQVVDCKTGKPVGWEALLMRCLAHQPSIVFAVADALMGWAGHGTVAVLLGTEHAQPAWNANFLLAMVLVAGIQNLMFLINGIMIFAKPDSRHLYDNLLGQQVIMKE